MQPRCYEREQSAVRNQRGALEVLDVAAVGITKTYFDGEEDGEVNNRLLGDAQ